MAKTEFGEKLHLNNFDMALVVVIILSLLTTSKRQNLACPVEAINRAMQNMQFRNEVPDEDALLEWKRKYSNSDHSVPKVHELRKFIVSFLTLLYPNNIVKKNFNWKVIPCDWPSEVPFLDPTKTTKTDGTTKPRKIDLECMYKHLVNRYKAYQIKEPVFSPALNKESLPSADVINEGLISVNNAIQVSYESSTWEDRPTFCIEGADFVWAPSSCHISYQAGMIESVECHVTMEPLAPYLMTEFSASTCEHTFRIKDSYLGIKTRVPHEDNLLGRSQIVHRNNLFNDRNIEATEKLESWDAMKMVNPRTGEPDRYQAKEALGKMEAVELYNSREFWNIIDSSKNPCESENKIKLTFTDAPENKYPKHSLDNEAEDDGRPPGKKTKREELNSSQADTFLSSRDFANGWQKDAKKLCRGLSRRVNKPRKEVTNFKMKPQLDPKKTKVKMKRRMDTSRAITIN